jgi:WhiB family redox-sensing transcriptional regulator
MRPGQAVTIDVAWWHDAACRERLDLDWIEPGARDKKRCRAVCAACPVQAACQRAALVTGEAWGIWGGLDPEERAVVAAEHGYPPPSVLPAHGTNSRYAKHRCPCAACRQAHAEYERHRRHRKGHGPTT